MSTEKSAKSVKTKKVYNRPKRAHSYRRSLLEAANRPGFHRHWFNEIPGKIEALIDSGYSIVLHRESDISDSALQNASPIGSPVRRVVNRRTDTSVTHAILLEIPQEMYDENQRLKEKEIEETETAKSPEAFVAENPGFYIPK